MSEWWTYRLSDFLLFAPRTYWRQFELMNAQWWPLQPLLLTAGGLIALALWRGSAPVRRLGALGLALAWALSAWAFLWQRYAGIHWLAPWFAAAFGLQALLLAALAWRAAPAPSRLAALWVLGAVPLYPLLGRLAGRPWVQAEVFALAPDPSAIAGFALLLGQRTRWALPAWPIPLAWCALSGATLWTMEDALAAVPPLAALGALAVMVTLSFGTGPARSAPCRAAPP